MPSKQQILNDIETKITTAINQDSISPIIVGGILTDVINFADEQIIYNFTNQDTVLITHNLNKKPEVKILLNGTHRVESDIRYIDNDSLEITFAKPYTVTVIIK